VQTRVSNIFLHFMERRPFRGEFGCSTSHFPVSVMQQNVSLDSNRFSCCWLARTLKHGRGRPARPARFFCCRWDMRCQANEGKSGARKNARVQRKIVGGGKLAGPYDTKSRFIALIVDHFNWKREQTLFSLSDMW
jgi:hypothetical protein